MMTERNNRPPQWPRRLLLWWSGSADIEDLLGDIDEFYGVNSEEIGRRMARWIYFRQVLSLCMSYGLRSRKNAVGDGTKNSNIPLLVNHTKIAARNFYKHRLFTTVNIIGLATGMSICLLALSIAVAIFNSDEFHSKKDRIVQINTFVEQADQTKTYGSVFPAVGTYLQDNYPFVEEVVRIRRGFKPQFEQRGERLDFHGYYADPSFFDVFDFEMILGDPKTALSMPNSLVLTQTAAEKLFNEENPINKTLKAASGDFIVTGVMADLKQTHLYFECLTSWNTLGMKPQTTVDWIDHRDSYLYLLMQPGTDDLRLQEALHQTSQIAMDFNPDKYIELESIALSNVVPRWNISQALGIGWDYPSLVFFLFIGGLILLPAIFNYTNLSIARALKRAKEIGVRKVIGAQKRQIKMQFLVETLLLSFCSLLVSTLIYVPLRNEFLEMVIAAEVLDMSPGIILVSVFVIFGLAIGLISGVFPALYFSRMSPIHTLKGEIKNRTSRISGIKKGLFVIQFVLSLFFLIGVATIVRQYAYVFNANHGFTSDNVLVVPFSDQDKQLVLNELGNHQDVMAISASSNLPGLRLPAKTPITVNDVDTALVSQVFIGDDFIQNMRMKMIWGFEDAIMTSTQNEERVLVNEEFLKDMTVFHGRKDSLRFVMEDGTDCLIVGVIENMNFEPLSELIRPIIFRRSLERSNFALLTVSSNDIAQTIEELEGIWIGLDQDIRFESSFLNDEIERAYYFLRAQIKIFSYLSVFAIIISCLGLLGMVVYSTEGRIKEIAIRKIMGASVGSLYYLLTRDFARLIGISALIAIPLAYVFYDKLFLYFLIRYGLGLGTIEVLLSVLFLFSVGFLSIFWQTSKVTKENPAGNLRYE